MLPPQVDAQAHTPDEAPLSKVAPVLPPDVPCYFLPKDTTSPATYVPVLVGVAHLHYLDEKRGVDESRDLVFTTAIPEAPTPVSWEQAKQTDLAVDELEREAEPGLSFANLPPEAAQTRNYANWNKTFANWLFQTQQITLFRSASLDELSKPGENERDFRVRLQQAAREERDRQAEALKQKYAPKLASLTERTRRAQAAAGQQKAQQNQAFLQTAVSVGTGLLGAFLGRKPISATTVNRAATAARQAGRSWKEMQDVGQANENVELLNQQTALLQQQFDAELHALESKIDPASEHFESVNIRLKKTNIEIRLVALAWKAQ